MQSCDSSFQNCDYQLHLQKVSVSLQCLQTAKSLISSCRRIGETILQQLLAKHSDNCCSSLISEAATGLLIFYEETPTQVFPCKICEMFKNPYFEEHLRTTSSVPFFITHQLFHYYHFHYQQKQSFPDVLQNRCSLILDLTKSEFLKGFFNLYVLRFLFTIIKKNYDLLQ